MAQSRRRRGSRIARMISPGIWKCWRWSFRRFVAGSGEYDFEERAMTCAVHPEADAVGYCRNCGKAMCAVCVRPVRDVLYCEDCLAHVMGLPTTTAAGAPGAPMPTPADPGPGRRPAPGLGPSPLLAFFLGFLPGLGAFYNEQYGKGIIHLAIFLF